MKTILITGIGGDISQSVAIIINEHYEDVRLVGVDMGSKHAGELLVDNFIVVPPASSSSYLDAIRKVIVDYQVDLIIPITEEELSRFSPLMDELGQNRCITAGKEVIDIGTDKLKTIEFISSLGIPVPWTALAENIIPKEFPCIFKARSGSGSKNIFTIYSQNEADFLSKRFPNSIFQGFLEPEDQEVTCAVYRARDGRVAVLQLLRKLTEGTTSWAKVIRNDAVFDMCKHIANELDLQGSINIQLRITNQGPRIFEINPRFSSTILMRHRLGFCDVLWALSEAEGGVVVFPDIAIGQRMVRVQDTKLLTD